MKTTCVILILLVTKHLFGQDASKIYLFQTVHYNSYDNSVSQTELDTIKWSNKIDLNFYGKNFYLPYTYPDNFINPEYSNQSVIVWRDSSSQDNKSNWSYTYKYDSLSRLTEYKYSSCFVCGSQPFNFEIFYDEKNRPVCMQNIASFHLRKILADANQSDDSLIPEEEYEFKYDENSNIIQLKYFVDRKLTTQVDKL